MSECYKKNNDPRFVLKFLFLSVRVQCGQDNFED